MQSLFERTGGFPKVSKIVSRFYDRVLDDPQLSPFFAGVDMKRQIDHQTKLFASLMGGPASFSDEHLTRVHAHLGITSDDFVRLSGVLRDTLEDSNMPETDIGELMAEFRSKRQLVVTK